jgi:hypothetical protein
VVNGFHARSHEASQWLVAASDSKLNRLCGCGTRQLWQIAQFPWEPSLSRNACHALCRGGSKDLQSRSTMPGLPPTQARPEIHI